MTRSTRAVALIILAVTPLTAQAQAKRVEAAALRKHLFTIAADSMGGRDTGSRGNFLTAEYVAAQFKAAGLEPAGDNGTYFQTVPFIHIHLDPAARLAVGTRRLKPGSDFLPSAMVDTKLDNAQAVFAGVATDSTTWIPAEAARGRLLIFVPPADATARTATQGYAALTRSPRFMDAAGFALVAIEYTPLDMRAQRLQGQFRTTPPPPPLPGTPVSRPVLTISRPAAAAMLGGDVAGMKPGKAGLNVSGTLTVLRDSLPYPARNVVAVLRGSDPVARNTFMALTAHNDHVGYTFAPADHDSVLAHNRVIRGLGADTPDRTPSPAEQQRITAIRDSLRRIRKSVPDSIFNGADDDGTGTVALIEAARTLAAGPRPARSILFVNHVAEERGLLGSQWFTSHPTVERDSIVGEMDMDMIGRGNASDLPAGGVGYLEVVGAKRLSREYGEMLEQVNAKQPTPFTFNYEFDAPGHPLQYYCRADHYSYARWSIPAFAVSRGEHSDYHQVTDEAEYIDYNVLARVANLATDFARMIANLDHRAKLDAPKADPNTPCRQ